MHVWGLSVKCTIFTSQLCVVLCSGWFAWWTEPLLMWCPALQCLLCATEWWPEKTKKHCVKRAARWRARNAAESRTHLGFIHGCEYRIPDQSCVIIQPGGTQKRKKNPVKRVAWQMEAESAQTYLRWSSIMQLASNRAVGFAMFLFAILLPVFLVAWGGKKSSSAHLANTTVAISILVQQKSPRTVSKTA